MKSTDALLDHILGGLDVGTRGETIIRYEAGRMGTLLASS